MTIRGLALGRQQLVAGTATGLDWMISLLSVFLVGGVYLDGWAHIHLGQLETFFTPWHAVLYSGFISVAAVLVGATILRRASGVHGLAAIPRGYKAALFGVLVFALAGVGDMVWHIVFGIEMDLEALLSPTHLLLAAGGALIVSGPLRAAWGHERHPDVSFLAFLPILVSMTLLLAVLAFMTQYVHPFGTTWAAGTRGPAEWLGSVGDVEVSGFHIASYFTFFEQLTTTAGIMLQTSIFIGLVLLVRRRWLLPAGSLTFLLTVSTMMITLMRNRFLAPGPLPLIVVAAAAGIVADVLLIGLRPAPDRPAAVRVFAFAVPAVLYGFYLTALALTVGTWWSVHLWTGATVLAGFTGLLVSYLVVPLDSPAPRTRSWPSAAESSALSE